MGNGGSPHFRPGNRLLLQGDGHSIEIGTAAGALVQSLDGGADSALGGGGGFGSDTIVQVLNSNATLVNAWESIVSLDLATAGNEEALWMLKMMQSGAPIFWGGFGFTAGGNFPTLFFGPSANGDGMRGLVGSHALQVLISGTNVLQIVGTAFQFQPGVGLTLQGRLQEGRAGNTASATTLTLPTNPAGNLFPITGTTTVNGITTSGWQAGSRFILELPSGITITHNSGAPGGGAVAIQLNAAANLTTARVTMLELVYNGTFFYQVG
jgi:hypothetical protein